jgi:rhamnulose-1-phosphate aldolase/alcohol dehydrogenase
MASFKHVNYLWDDTRAARLSAVERLVYRSNLLGSDQRITNTGGGNTSSKLEETDPLSGAKTTVLWVKGSGGDLRTAKTENFSSLYQQKLIDLQSLYAKRADKGLKSPAEDDMVGMYAHTTFNLNPRPSSIDTPLHSFLPGKFVDHMHPNAIIAIAASARCEELTREIFGGKMAYVPWMRPGFELGLAMQEIARKNPQVKAIMMGGHGFISWADDEKVCYTETLKFIETAAEFIEKTYAAKGGDAAAFGGAKYKSLEESARQDVFAAVLPWLRGEVSKQKRFIGTIQDDAKILRFVNSQDAPRLAALGTSCPDHFLRTKIKPLYTDWDPQNENVDTLKHKLAAGLEQYRKDYAAYYNACKHPNSPAMRDPNPTVILIPGVGMIAWGKDKSESRVTAEFYNCAVEVMRGAEAIDRYVALPQQEAFDIEYWLLEEAKLQRMPAEKELARKVVAIVGAGSGIGRETALRLVKEGAHVVCADLNEKGVAETVELINAKFGLGIGVAGTGVSNCGLATGTTVNVTQRETLRAAIRHAVLAYGGLDSIVVTAGFIASMDRDGRIKDEGWGLTYDINVIGACWSVEEAAEIFKQQGLPATAVITTSANAVVPKRGSLAYDTSKAAANHLIRELAIDLAPLVRVNGVAPATVVKGSGLFPRERVIANLVKYKLPAGDDEADDVLVNRLAQFYADRTLTKVPIEPADQAEAIFLCVSDRLAKTTGQILAVDGGLHEAFLR